MSSIKCYTDKIVEWKHGDGYVDKFMRCALSFDELSEAKLFGAYVTTVHNAIQYARGVRISYSPLKKGHLLGRISFPSGDSFELSNLDIVDSPKDVPGKKRQRKAVLMVALFEAHADKIFECYPERSVSERNKEKQAGAYENYDQILEDLQALSPLLFDLEKPLPLKIGITEDLASAINRPFYEVSGMLSKWCKRPQYLRSFAHHAYRFGIDGEEVTNDENMITNLTPLARRAIASEEQKEAKAIYRNLSKMFPDIFNPDDPKPLYRAKVIDALTAAIKLPEDKIEVVLKWWSRRHEYFKDLDRHLYMYDLDGNRYEVKSNSDGLLRKN